MKVILLKDISGLGQRGTVKEVSDGYALNRLIPNKMAQMATPEALKAHEKHVAEDKAARDAREKEWGIIAEKLKSFTLPISAKASAQGHLYKKIASADIVTALREKGFAVPDDAIHLKTPLKEIGKKVLELSLGERKVELMVEIVAA